MDTVTRAFDLVAAAAADAWTALVNSHMPGKFVAFSGIRFLVQGTTDAGVLTITPAKGEPYLVKLLVVSNASGVGSHMFTVKAYTSAKHGGPWQVVNQTSVPRVRGETLDSLYRSFLKEIGAIVAELVGKKEIPSPEEAMQARRASYLDGLKPVRVTCEGPGVAVDIYVPGARAGELQARLREVAREFGNR